MLSDLAVDLVALPSAVVAAAADAPLLGAAHDGDGGHLHGAPDSARSDSQQVSAARRAAYDEDEDCPLPAGYSAAGIRGALALSPGGVAQPPTPRAEDAPHAPVTALSAPPRSEAAAPLPVPAVSAPSSHRLPSSSSHPLPPDAASGGVPSTPHAAPPLAATASSSSAPLSISSGVLMAAGKGAAPGPQGRQAKQRTATGLPLGTDVLFGEDPLAAAPRQAAVLSAAAAPAGAPPHALRGHAPPERPLKAAASIGGNPFDDAYHAGSGGGTGSRVGTGTSSSGTSSVFDDGEEGGARPSLPAAPLLLARPGALGDEEWDLR